MSIWKIDRTEKRKERKKKGRRERSDKAHGREKKKRGENRESYLCNLITSDYK